MGIWNIVTLVTLSSGVSRGIHHNCKHSLNSTRLYVSGWVELSLSVLIWKVITCLDDVCWTVKVYLFTWQNLFGCRLPFACLITLYVVLLPLRWSSIYLWEHMREVLVVNIEMIPLHSLLGLDFMFLLSFFFRVMAHVLGCLLDFYIILLNFITCFFVCIGL